MALLTGTNSPLAETTAGKEAVIALGTLNGIALQCRYIEQVRRMKAAVVANAPKERVYGIAFDDSTNDSFVAFLENRQQCQGEATFSLQVDTAIEQLEQAFAK